MKKIEFTKEWLHANRLAIECENIQEAKRICEIFGSEYLYDFECTDIYVPYKISDIFFISDCLFTVKEWAIANHLNTLKASEVIAQYEASKRKIIGYRCPFDMFGGRIKKDTLYCKFDDIHYTPKDYELSSVFLPHEIVETWQPVYEEVKPCFGSWGDVMQFAHKNQTTVLVHANNRINFGNIGDATQEKYSFTDEFKEELKALSIWI